MPRNKLSALERLQSLDAELEELTKTASRFPAQRAQLEADAATARDAADQERGRLADNERAQRSVAGQLEAEEDKVRKWEGRLPSLKHPREFAALQREVETAKRMNLEAEELRQRLEAEGVEIKASLRVKEAELARRQAALAAVAANTKAQEAELAEKIAGLTTSRDEVKAAVDPALLKSYDTISRRRPGSALVPAAGGCCSGCHRKLPPQTMNRLYAAGTVEICPSCLRLVYVPLAPESARTS